MTEVTEGGELRREDFERLYVLRRLIARGGMGEVHQAEQRSLGRVVAIKLLGALGPDAGADRRRFQEEARLLCRLAHPNVVKIFDAGVVEGRPFIVMEHVEGSDLHTVASGRPVADGAWVKWMSAALDGLDYLHQSGVQHRDIKLSNLLLDGDGAVKIVDFGLARDELSPGLTEDGVTPGTPLYMAPERIAGAPASVASDLYSVGVLLHLALTGQPPRGRTGDASAFVRSRTSTDALPAAMVEPSLDPELASIIDHLLQRDPARRPASAREVRDRLQEVGVRWASDGRTPRFVEALVTRNLARGRETSTDPAADPGRTRDHGGREPPPAVGASQGDEDPFSGVRASIGLGALRGRGPVIFLTSIAVGVLVVLGAWALGRGPPSAPARMVPGSLRVEREVERLRLSLRTDLPCRLAVAVEPSGPAASLEAEPVTSHVMEITGLDPLLDYELSARQAGAAADAPLAVATVRSPVPLLGAVLEQLGDEAVEDLTARMAGTVSEVTAAARHLERGLVQLGWHQVRDADARWVRLVLDDPRVAAAARARRISGAMRLRRLDRFAQLEGLPFASGADEVLGPVFSQRVLPFEGASRLEIAVDPGTAIFQTGLRLRRLSKKLESKLTSSLEIPQGARFTEGQLVIGLTGLAPDTALQVTLDPPGLVLELWGPFGPSTGRFPLLRHGLDARLLGPGCVAVGFDLVSCTAGPKVERLISLLSDSEEDSTREGTMCRIESAHLDLR